MTRSETPNVQTIHSQFGVALLSEALSGSGRTRVAVPLQTEAQTLHVWAPRVGENEAHPPHPQERDPKKRVSQRILDSALSGAGIDSVTVDVPEETLHLDFYFEPSVPRNPAPGLLGKIASVPAIFWVLAEPPDEDVLREHLLHAITFQGVLDREAGRKMKKPIPVTWTIGMDLSKTVVQAYSMKTKKGWPDAVRFGPSVFDVRAVSVELLPETRETLFLRLLGTGKVLERALAEQGQLDADAPERRATRVALNRVCPGGDAPVPIRDATSTPTLRACRQIYQRWARDLARA